MFIGVADGSHWDSKVLDNIIYICDILKYETKIN